MKRRENLRLGWMIVKQQSVNTAWPPMNVLQPDIRLSISTGHRLPCAPPSLFFKDIFPRALDKMVFKTLMKTIHHLWRIFNQDLRNLTSSWLFNLSNCTRKIQPQHIYLIHLSSEHFQARADNKGYSVIKGIWRHMLWLVHRSNNLILLSFWSVFSELEYKSVFC